MDSDQGSVFGSEECVSLLASKLVAQSMDGRARWAYNVLMERRSKTLESECLRNAEYETPAQLEDLIRGFADECNTTRPHHSQGCATPSEWCFSGRREAA